MVAKFYRHRSPIVFKKYILTIGEEYEVEVHFFLFLLIFKALTTENLKLVHFDLDGRPFRATRNKPTTGIL